MAEMLDLKVGDAVVVSSRWSRAIRKVEKITPKGAIRVDGTLYHPDGTQKGGDSWNKSHIKKATEEDIKEIREAAYITKTLVKLRECKSLTYEQAVAIRKVLEA